MIEKHLRSKICELLPSLAGRVYPQSAPEQTIPPYGVYACISSSDDSALSGECAVFSETIQLDIYATSYKEVKAYADTLRMALMDYTGDLSGYPVGYIKIVNIMDGYEPEVDDQKVTLELEIFY
jgi:hypothetical protein